MNDRTKRVRSAVPHGIDGEIVEITAVIGGAPPGFYVAGRQDGSFAEAKDRVRAAVVNSGLAWPTERITLSISPAAPRAPRSAIDAALACAVLAATGALEHGIPDDVVVLGELGLDGTVRAVRGVLPCLLAARAAGARRAVVPAAVLDEARIVEDLHVYGATSLSEILDHLRSSRRRRLQPKRATPHPPLDLVDVRGQDEVKRAVEIAAAGGHHVLVIGGPGAGATILAQLFAGLLPPLSSEEALRLAAIRSMAQRLSVEHGLSTTPPLVTPHRSSSMAALFGGSRPGAVSMAYRGVLFLDSAPDWSTRALDTMSGVLDSGEVRLARAEEGTVVYPARCQLLLTSPTCPCAAEQRCECTCTEGQRRRFRARLSGPLFDRVDIWAHLQPVRARSSSSAAAAGAEDSATVRARVLAARSAAAERWAESGERTNAAVSPALLRTRFALSSRTRRPLDAALRVGELTNRGADRALRLAWTLADLSGRERPDLDLVEQALAMRLRPPSRR